MNLSINEIYFSQLTPNLISVNTTGNKKIVKVGVTGDVSSISNISFVNKDGNPILSNVKFTLDKDWENHLTEHIDHPENTKKELKIDVDKVPKDSFYAVIDGKDSKGKYLSFIKFARFLKCLKKFQNCLQELKKLLLLQVNQKIDWCLKK